MYRFLIELLFENWINEIPTAAAIFERQWGKDEYCIIQISNAFELLSVNSPTMPKRTQYIAANIGKGIEAKKAPNLPENTEKFSRHQVNVLFILFWS